MFLRKLAVLANLTTRDLIIFNVNCSSKNFEFIVPEKDEKNNAETVNFLSMGGS